MQHRNLFVFDIETVPDTDAVENLTGFTDPNMSARREELERYHLEVTDGRNAFALRFGRTSRRRTARPAGCCCSPRRICRSSPTASPLPGSSTTRTAPPWTWRPGVFPPSSNGPAGLATR